MQNEGRLLFVGLSSGVDVRMETERKSGRVQTQVDGESCRRQSGMRARLLASLVDSDFIQPCSAS